MVTRLFVLTLFLTFIWSEETVNVEVDRKKINEGDTIVLSISVYNFLKEPNIILPKMKSFKILSGPSKSSSTNVQVINGRMKKTSTLVFEWTLLPLVSGNITIPVIKINTSNNIYNSQPINIIVNKRDTENSSIAPKFFIEAEVDNLKPYRGQQITLHYILYTQVDITSLEDELPKFKGFWTEEIFSAKKLQLREVKKNNKQYYAATIKKIALFPTKSGEIAIDPLTAVIGVREKEQRWNDFSLFGPPSKKYTIAANRIELDVLSIPDRKRGVKSAVVGNWHIKSNINSKTLVQDQANTIQVIVSGTGNIHAVDLSEMNFPNGLEVFDPKIEIKKNPLRDELGGQKIYEWVFIPRNSGELVFPKFELNYFNPSIQKWLTKSTVEYKLDVLPNPKANNIPVGLTKEEVSLVGKDIRFIDESLPKWKKINNSLFTFLNIVIVFLSCFIFIMPYVYEFIMKKLGKNLVPKNYNKAYKVASGVLNSKTISCKEQYSNIYNSMVTYINMKTGSQKVEYSTNEIIDIIKKHVGESILNELEEILKRVEVARFSPISSRDIEIDVEAIKSLLFEIENAWS